MSKAFRTKLLFQKYLNNSCTEVELEELFELLKDEHNLEVTEDALLQLWHKDPLDKKNEDLQNLEMYHKFKTRINAQRLSYTYPRQKRPFYKWVAAACLLIGIVFGSYFLLQHLKFKPDNKIENRTTLVKLSPRVKRIVLSDGSTVVLNKGSHLNYPEKFGNTKREVYLIGEGYFDIKHDTKRPFLVHTGKLTTRVLGTAFNIKADPGKHTIEVTVTRGKVAVSGPKRNQTILLPDQRVSYNVKSNEIRKESANSKLAILWKEEDLVLNNTSIIQAARILQDRYGVQILLESDKIKDCRFTAYFLNTTSLRQVIDVIGKLNNLNYVKNENGAYILSGNGCE